MACRMEYTWNGLKEPSACGVPKVESVLALGVAVKATYPRETASRGDVQPKKEA